MSTVELWRYSAHLGDQEQASQRHEIQFWKKALYPFACLVMMALALPFAYLHARAGGVSLKVFGGIMLGISFVLLNNVSGHLGMLRDWTPWVAASAPGADLPGCCRWPRSAGWCAFDERPRRTAAQRGLLLFAHGARDAAWAAPFEAVAGARARAAARVAGGAGLSGADAARSGRRRRATGAARLPTGRRGAAVPRHRRPRATDLPLLLQRLQSEHPGTRWTLHDPVGEHPDVIEAIARAAAAIALTHAIDLSGPIDEP